MNDDTEINPAPYSPTDASERKAVVLLLSQLDLARTKPDIKVADKIPNTDGTIEVVDEASRPLGMLSVQVRSIGTAQTTYDCPVSLLAYSERCSHPFILVLADVETNSVYWKHLEPLMPEAKRDQKTFTIRLADGDKISPDQRYRLRWEALIRDYRSRVAEYPSIKKEYDDKIAITGLKLEDCAYFQEYIGTINNLLDNDFIAVKKQLLADVWKLGVAVTGIDDNAVAYRLFKIPKGRPMPLVCTADGGPLDMDPKDGSIFSWHTSVREYMGQATEAGRRVVLDHVEKAVRGRRLGIYGTALSVDVIFAFMHRYAHVFRLSEASTYTLAELTDGIQLVLPRLCSAYATTFARAVQTSMIYIDFDALSSFARRHDQMRDEQQSQTASWALFSPLVNLRSVGEAIDFLTTSQCDAISTPLRPPTSSGKWIWSQYTTEEQISNAKYVLSQSISQYSAFVRGNCLHLPSSPYLDAGTTIVFVFSPSDEAEERAGPLLAEFHVDNHTGTLPKLIVQIDQQTKWNIGSARHYQLTWQGAKLDSRWISFGDGSFLVHRTPLLNTVYRLLAGDLQRHYKTHYMACEYP